MMTHIPTDSMEKALLPNHFRWRSAATQLITSRGELLVLLLYGPILLGA